MHPLEYELTGAYNDYSLLEEKLSALPNAHFSGMYESILAAYSLDSDIYYHLDGHFNERGYSIIANEAFRLMQEQCHDIEIAN